MLVRNGYTHDTRVEREAATLHGAGYDVTVVAEARDGQPERETRAGVTVIRVRRHGSNLPGIRFLAHQRRVAAAVLATRPGILHAHDTDGLQVIGPVAARIGVPFVYDAHELWLGLGRRGRPAWYAALSRFYYWMVERRYIPRAAAVVVANPPVASELERRYGIRGVIRVPNFPADAVDDREPVRADIRALPGGERIPQAPFVIYVGGMAPERGIEQLIEAMALLPQRHLVFLGAGGAYEPVVRSLADRLGLTERVHYLAAVPSELVVPYAANAAVGVAANQPTSLNNRLALPNKVFQYMAAAVPVVASDYPQIREIILAAGCGTVVDAREPAAIAAGLATYLDDPARARREGLSGRNAVRERYHWRVAADELLAAYRFMDVPAAGLPIES